MNSTKRARPIAALFVILGLLWLTACSRTVTVGTSPPQTPAQDPLVGTWEMARTNIHPEIPAPNLLISRFIPEKATWQITRVNGVLKINYGGKDTWYNTLGIDVAKRPIVTTEGSNSRTCTFASGGSIYLEKMPWIIKVLLPSRTMEQVSINFDDSVFLVLPIEYDPCCLECLTLDNMLTAIIDIDSQVKYYGQDEFDGEWKAFNDKRTINYQGIRRQ